MSDQPGIQMPVWTLLILLSHFSGLASASTISKSLLSQPSIDESISKTKSDSSQKEACFLDRTEKIIPKQFLTTISSINQKLFSDILSAPNLKTLPAPRVGDDSRIIAAALVRRLYERNKGADHNPAGLDYYHGTEIGIAFRSNLAESITTNCFLNQHQTLKSSGTYDLESRKKLEDQMINMTLDPEYSSDPTHPIQNIRPKYAYLFATDEKLRLLSTYVPRYGNVIAILKDEIKDRATFTPGDSLVLSNDYSPGEFTHTFFERPAKPTQMIKTEYWEAQVWGPLCVNDVKYFLVNCPGLDAPTAKEIQAMKDTGAPVYPCARRDGDWGYGTPVPDPKAKIRAAPAVLQTPPPMQKIEDPLLNPKSDSLRSF